MNRSVFIYVVSGIWLLFSPNLHAIVDINQNVLSDLWERQFNNGDLFDENINAAADDDSDGWTNAQEAAAGTDPFDPNPPDGIIRPLILHVPAVMGEENGQPIIITPETVGVRWTTIPGKQYALLASSNLAWDGWLPAEDAFIGNGSEVTYWFPCADPEFNPAALFWRIAVNDVDTDADGLTDHEESVIGTSPTNADTDGDGFSDSEEFHVGTLPLDPSSYPLKVTHTLPDHMVETGSAYGHPSGQPLLLYFNRELPASVTSIAGPWLYNANGGNTLPAPGDAIILPGRKAVAFIPTGGSFKTWEEVGDETPTYHILFDTESTGIPHLIPLYGTFTITSTEGSAGHGPWISGVSPGRDHIDADFTMPIRVGWNEPLDPATVIPGNLIVTAADSTVIGTTVAFDYGRNTNLMTIAPSQPLAPATRYTVTLGTGFQNLTGKAHATPLVWSFTTRPVRPAPNGVGPYITAISPPDFTFGIAPPESVSITFSEDMDPDSMIPENIRIRGWLGNVLPGTFTYTAATRTLVFLPEEPFTPHTYFSLEFDHGNIFNLPLGGDPVQLQDNGGHSFSTSTPEGGGTGGTGGEDDENSTPAPDALAPLGLHYTWGKIYEESGGGSGGSSSGESNALPFIPQSGCSVDIKLTDKKGVESDKNLPANIEAVQVADSGDIAPATTVKVTPVFVPGSKEADTLSEKKKNGVYVLPTDAMPPPGMTYHVFLQTPPEEGSTEADTVEYLGPFGSRVDARCATEEGKGPQTLYFVPIPVVRSIMGLPDPGWNLLEGEHSRALPGQRMDLKVQDRYLTSYGPPQATIDSFEWPATDLGKTFKEFHGYLNFSDYQELLPEDLAAQEIKFYRTKGDDTMAAKAEFQIKISGSTVGNAEAIGHIRVDQPTSTFDLEIGEEKVTDAPNKVGEIVPMFGLYKKGEGQVFRGVKFNGMVETPPRWSHGEWNFVQLIKSRRNYTYQGGAQTHMGDGQTLKLDTKFPYSINFTADGTPKDDDSCGDTPRDPLTGSPPPNHQSTPRTQIEVHESFETYIMFKPSGTASRYVPLRRAKWQWGGTINSANNWTPVAGPESPNSNNSGEEYFEHPQWDENTTSDVETANP